MSKTPLFCDSALAGRTAVVTGATRGLGFEIAKALAAAGAKVWLNGRGTDSTAQAVTRLHAEGLLETHALPFDVTDAAARDRAFAVLDSAAAPGAAPLHILVNNVGLRDRRPLEAFAAPDIERLLSANVLAPFELARLAAARMQPGGSILNLTSIAGPIANPGDALYTVTKGALDAMTRALAAELGPRALRVNAIAPGVFATETNAALAADPAMARWLQSRSALGRIGQPAEIAGAAVFLASDAASYVTGHTLVVDGGVSTHY